MVITLGGATLCDGPDRSVNKSAGPADYVLDRIKDHQVSKPLRSENAVLFNRGNRQTEVSFNVRRLCATVDAALAWITQHAIDVPDFGTLVLGTSGQVLTAHLDRINFRHTGVTVFVTYHISGGKLEQIT